MLWSRIGRLSDERDEREARVGERPCREHEDLVHRRNRRSLRASEQWPVGHSPL